MGSETRCVPAVPRSRTALRNVRLSLVGATACKASPARSHGPECSPRFAMLNRPGESARSRRRRLARCRRPATHPLAVAVCQHVGPGPSRWTYATIRHRSPAPANKPNADRDPVRLRDIATPATHAGPNAIGPSEIRPSAPAAPTVAHAQNHAHGTQCRRPPDTGTLEYASVPGTSRRTLRLLMQPPERRARRRRLDRRRAAGRSRAQEPSVERSNARRRLVPAVLIVARRCGQILT
jgi:hypothetical protein